MACLCKWMAARVHGQMNQESRALKWKMELIPKYGYDYAQEQV